MFRRRILFLISSFSFLLIANLAQANIPNYNSILIGDRAAGMGGAYTALYEDSSAIAWYNPAGLALLRGRSFSAAVGIYKKFDTIYNNSEDLTSASLKANQGFFRPVPSSLGNVHRFQEFLKYWTFALSIVVPYYDTFKGQVSKDATNVSTLQMTDESLWVGAAMARKISKNQALGVTLYYTARSFSRTVNDRTVTDATHAKIYTEELAYTQNAVVPVIGYHFGLDDNWKFGLSWRMPSWSVAGKGTYDATTIDSGITTTTTNNNLSTKARIPQKYSLGIAYLFPGMATLSFDASYYAPMSYSSIEEAGIGESLRHKGIINLAGGIEINYRDWIKFRLGGFTNFSSYPDPDTATTRGEGDHVDMIGWSANAALKSGHIQYTFGGYYVGGRGRSVQRVNHQYTDMPKAMQVFTMLVGTAYVF